MLNFELDIPELKRPKPMNREIELSLLEIRKKKIFEQRFILGACIITMVISISCNLLSLWVS
jgi:hypothetical protein